MDFEAAILLAIVMAFGLHVRAHPLNVSQDVLAYVFSNPAMLCMEMEVGLPCPDSHFIEADQAVRIAHSSAP